MNRILLTGATGILGTAVIETLSKKIAINQISIITRNEQKRAALEAKGFTAFLGNYDNKTSLEKAMLDVDTVLLISAGDQGDRLQEHRNVVDAAVNVGVPNIAYTSRSLKDRTILANKLMLDHFETEDYIKTSGLKHTIFRNALYMDVIPLFVGKDVFEKGIFQPAGDGRVAFALRREQGEAMANVLVKEGFENKTYSFTGNESYSFYDVAMALTELSNKAVNYTPVDVLAFENMMLQKGIPQPMVKKIVDFNTDIKNGQEEETTNHLEMKLGRKPASLKEGLKELFSL
jgi:NAD(P)H dehydrogenase (quinone)